ncbi:MAG: aromatic amino acid transport family protein [Candidatus Nanoarchaeia archaeon]
MEKGFWSSVFTLVGVTVGAGIFGLPYVIAKAGFLTSLLMLIVLGCTICFVSLCLGEVVLRTKGKHQLSGLGKKYLPVHARLVLILAVFISIYGALFAYLLGAGEVLSSLIGINADLASWLFFFLLAIVLLFNLKVIEKIENIFTPLKIICAVLLSLAALPLINANNLTEFSFSKLLIPYGVILFSYLGISAIPEMAAELKSKKELDKAIKVGVFISGGVYFLYGLALVGVFGVNQIEVSTLSLSSLGVFFFIFGNIFALLALGTAFMTLGFALKDNLTLDLKQKPLTAWALVLALPALLLLLKVNSFVKVLEWSGVLGGGFILLSILWMHHVVKKKGERKPEYFIKDLNWVKVLIAVLIIIGIVYQLM